ncbi:MAG: hypothetical protein RSG96_10650 [Clostridia bacterium]
MSPVSYIQYNESSNGKKISAWMPADRLAALFYGDLVCMDGGAEAFEKDEESALLVMGSSENDALVATLGENYPLLNENGSIVIFENLW